eukprot:TRINITY_DN1617_c2_g1_i1.p1 TRINITY_DN1617_c2_g1~~TRINITY_DN1617_c2_g1_i1.p1  ORF type:complete len:168 (+),score=34.68 TRINITY_DN1617_c2_g1_i1:911-1414(+)
MEDKEEEKVEKKDFEKCKTPAVEMMTTNPPSTGSAEAAKQATQVCEHPAERLVRQRRKIKGSGNCCGCCYDTEMVHKCMRCGKVSKPPVVLAPGTKEYTAAQEAMEAKKQGKTLTSAQQAALGGLVVGAAGCMMLYAAWNIDDVTRYEPITNRGGGGCAAVCGGGVG